MEVTDPFTGQKSLVTIDRTGHTEQKLIVALADPKLNRDQKDHALSMYLFERGKESMSLIVDLMRYKGQHSKENRVFQSRMRFDFEMFANSFIEFLNSQADRVSKWVGVDVREEKKLFANWQQLPENKDRPLTFRDYWGEREEVDGCMIEQAIYAIDEAEHLLLQIRQVTAAREAQKGGGIYVDRSGRPYSVNDPDIDEIIKQDRNIQAAAEQDI